MDPMQAQLDAFNTRDLEAFITCYAPEIVIEGPDGAVMMRGREEMRAMYGQLFAQSPELHCKVTSRIRVGAYAIDEEHTTGFVFAGFPTELHGAVVCRLEGGRIAHMRLLAAESEESMSIEQSATVVRRYYDLLTSHPNDVGFYDVVAPDAIFREPGRTLQGREAFRKRVADFTTAFPDLRCSIDDLVADEDKVAVRWTLSGTHRGAFGPYPATNKQVTLTGIGLHRVANGQMVEGWGCFDTLGASLQLGANLVLPELATSK